jgi:hypothetical protein
MAPIPKRGALVNSGAVSRAHVAGARQHLAVAVPGRLPAVRSVVKGLVLLVAVALKIYKKRRVGATR